MLPTGGTSIDVSVLKRQSRIYLIAAMITFAIFCVYAVADRQFMAGILFTIAVGNLSVSVVLDRVASCDVMTGSGEETKKEEAGGGR
jgi:hypothetical protein